MTGKSVKDIDRYQAVLNSLLALEENKFCADCESKGRFSTNVNFRTRWLIGCGGNSVRVDYVCEWESTSLYPYTRKCGVALIVRPIT